MEQNLEVSLNVCLERSRDDRVANCTQCQLLTSCFLMAGVLTGFLQFLLWLNTLACWRVPEISLHNVP